MPSLRSLQRAFAASLAGQPDSAVRRQVVPDGFTAAERLEIYRNSSRGALAAALRITYPAVERLVGAEFFDATARRFPLAHWPCAADLNEYGADFADFLESFAPARTLPYLPDVARLEWALSVAAHAEDVPPVDARQIAALDPASHRGLRFVPHPATQPLRLTYAADHIADAVLAGDDAAMREIDLSPGAVHLVVQRGARGVEARRVEPMEYEFLVALCGGAEWEILAGMAGSHASRLLASQLVDGRIAGLRTGAHSGVSS